MSRSITVHCIGIAPKKFGEQLIYTAMNKREVAQETHIAEKKGHKIAYWFAQTGTGCRILGTKAKFERIKPEHIKLPKMIICPACEGKPGKYFCPVCNNSGITTPGFEKGWQRWQIENIRKEHGLEVQK